jgi:glycerate kinase
MSRAWPPKRILVAPQAFKGSLTAPAVAEAIAAGLRAGWPWPDAPTITIQPLADGGEGTMQALMAAWGATPTIIPIEVAGPLPGQRVMASLGWLGDAAPTALVEMAQAAGLPLVAPDQLDPMRATTYGVGELIRAALDQGAQQIYVGLGGSATNDGGAGMAQALGARLLDAAGNDLPPGGGALAHLAHIDTTNLDPRLRATEVIGFTDVTSPLCGPTGASVIFGPQKGATPDQVRELDAALAHYVAILQRDLGADVANVPGAGAAGGLGAGLLAFAGAPLTPGAQAILDAVRIDQRLAACDLVITGEGRLDGQIAFGKITGELAVNASVSGVPLICVAGGLAPGYESAYDLGIAAIIVTADGPRPLADAMAHAPELICDAVARAVRLWAIPIATHSV